MSKDLRYTSNFLKGLTKLTGLPLKKVQQYAKENNPFNILEHPQVMEPNEKQLEKIGLLNEFISSYNLLKMHENENKIKLTSSSHSGQYFSSLLSGMKDKERFMIAFLDSSNSIIETKTISEGTVGQAPVFPREILKAAIASDCKSMVLAHNHPGGGLNPSVEDKALTQRLVDIFHPLDISILDHIIVAGASYTSMAERGYIPNNCKDRANYEPILLDGKSTVEEKSEEMQFDPQSEMEDEEWEL